MASGGKLELQRPNRVTRLYAYWALRTLKPASATANEAALLGDQTAITIQRGCLYSEGNETSAVAAQLKTNGIRMPMP